MGKPFAASYTPRKKNRMHLKPMHPSFSHRRIAVRTAVATLPDDQAQAIELAFFGGLTHQEIAGMLNEPLGTIKARIRRGMLKLKDSLRAYL